MSFRFVFVLALLAFGAHPTELMAQGGAAPAIGKGSRLRGIVLSAEDGTPLPSADITLVGLEVSVRSGADGRFDFGVLQPGPYIVQARFLGYAPYTVRAELADSSSLELSFRMRRQAVQLEELEVKAAPKTNRFEQLRQESGGFGTFITRKQVEERNTPFICDLLRGRIGLRVVPVGSGCTVRVSRAQGLSASGGGECPPRVFLDAARVDVSLLESNNVPTPNIEGIVIYRSSAETPAEFNAFNACGAIVIFTRSGP